MCLCVCECMCVLRGYMCVYVHAESKQSGANEQEQLTNMQYAPDQNKPAYLIQVVQPKQNTLDCAVNSNDHT